MFNVGDFINKSLRIMNLFYRPKRKEFMKMARITAIGMVGIGLIGLLTSMIFGII